MVFHRLAPEVKGRGLVLLSPVLADEVNRRDGIVA
jgi:hypothetical protein